MEGSCAGCGAPLDTSTAVYSASGTLICRGCEAKETIRDGDERAGSAILGAAFSSVVFGMSSIFCNPFLIVSIAALASGIGAIFALVQHPEHRRTLGQVRWITALVCALLGIVFASLRLLLSLIISVLLATS